MKTTRFSVVTMFVVAFVWLPLAQPPLLATAAAQPQTASGVKRVKRCKWVMVNGVQQRRCRWVAGQAHPSSSVAATPAAATAFPSVDPKPPPKFDSSWPCPPEGDATATSAADIALNRRKNRVDSGDFKPTTINSVLALQPPAGICGKKRSQWTPTQTKAIKKFEGTPLVLEGFLALVKNQNNQLEGGRQEGQESCNCHGDEDKFRDFHLWLLTAPGAPRGTASVVVEITPPVRAHHPNWTIDNLTAIANSGERVRVSGWLLFDQEHCPEVGKSRGTVWEIHPIIKFEHFVNGQWQEL